MALIASNLEKSYGKRKVVKGISLRVNPGEIVGLLGPNGAGKTTTFYMIVGLVRPDKGSIEIGGKSVSKMAVFRRARAGLGYLSQEPSIFRDMTVEDNLWAVIEHQKLERSEQKRKVDQLISEFGLDHVRHQAASTLSGGEKRRCEIARALTTSPKILLLDEPFVGIDPITVADIQEILQSLKKRGLGILITDHNVQATLEIVDRASIIYDGKVLTEGNSETLLNDPAARRVYLGEKFKI